MYFATLPGRKNFTVPLRGKPEATCSKFKNMFREIDQECKRYAKQ